MANLSPAEAAPRLLARAWQSEDGLPSNVVRAVAQAANGYLWVGTAEGVVRFDGQRFTGFRTEADIMLGRLTSLAVSQVHSATCERIARAWHQKGGGRQVDIEVFDAHKNGLKYITKGPMRRPANAVRSTANFGVNGEDILF